MSLPLSVRARVLSRPGPQPHNQIAATAPAQLTRVVAPAALPFARHEARRLSATFAAYPELFAPLFQGVRHG